MSQIQLFKIFIIGLLFQSLFSIELKPTDGKYDILKISVDGNNRTYYELSKNKELEFSFDDYGLKDLQGRFSLKIIARTLIASNSNSDKTFGLVLNIIDEENNIESKQLKFNKKSSDAISESKLGWNYTKAGFWLEEIDNIANSKVIVELLKGSPPIALKLILEEIDFRTNTAELSPTTKDKEYDILYKDVVSDTSYKNSDGWYLFNEDKQLQYKIKGPKIIRILSRVAMKTDNVVNSYSFDFRENGRYMAKFNYSAVKSGLSAMVKSTNDQLSGYSSSFFNVPEGIHYYTFKTNDYTDDIYIKLEVYEDKN